ncbi:MAG: hypothetical protein QM533_00535 [Cytophagales bacterium]|nr:hypothetical protein [Cytophagales bacterium]
MDKTRWLVVGAGGHGRSVAEAAELSGQFEVVGFLDDSQPAVEPVLGYGVKVPPGVTLAHGEAVDSTTNKYKND